MECYKENQLEMIDRPAFLVSNGMITYSNELAKHRTISSGTPIQNYLAESQDSYSNYQGGILYLTLQIGWILCGATVIRQGDIDIFLIDQESDQTQLQALSLAAQQLRVPLSNIMTLADLLFPALQEDDQKLKASQMRKSLFQLMRQITNMADAGRYTNLEKPTFVTTDLCAFTREIVEKANTTLDHTDIMIHYTCPQEPIFTQLDRERMERAVYNLLSNAVKFSKPGQAVNVTIHRNGKTACITVEDQGDGISVHVQSSLFHRYVREPAIEDSRFGLGLGMTLVRTAAAIHGGTVLLEKTKGTRVAMTIEIRKEVPGKLRSPSLRIGDYAGGRDIALLEFSEALPDIAFSEEN